MIKRILAALAVFTLPFAASFGADIQPVKPGEMLSGSETYVRMNTVLTADINFKKFECVDIGRGEEKAILSYWVSIDSNKVTTFWLNYKKQPVVLASTEHCLKIKKNLRVNMDFADGRNAKLTMRSGKNVVTIEIPWYGGGTPFVKNCGSRDIRASVDLLIKDLDKPIWLYGDSYINWNNQYRWPYYLYNEGIRNIMYDHISGGNSERLLRAFKNDLALGTPKYAVWCLGMNDPRDDKGLSAKWLNAVKEFISECEKRGITPILSTVPSVPSRYHALKSKWVRESGYRYIDFSSAVTDGDAREWHEGFLYKDGVHPDKAGAKALAEAAKAVLTSLE